MCNVVQLCLAAINNILLMLKWKHAFLLLLITIAWKMADRFASRRYSLKNKLGDPMIKNIELDHRKISWFPSVSQINNYFICLSLWLWQIIICSPLTNHDILPNLVQLLILKIGEGEKNYSEVEKLVEKVWHEKSFIFGLLFQWNLTSIVFVTGYKENSLQSTFFLQMSMKFKGSALLSSYIPYYNGFIKTTRK